MSSLLVKIGNSEIAAQSGKRVFRFPSRKSSISKLFSLNARREIQFASVVPGLSRSLKAYAKQKKWTCKEIKTSDIDFRFAYSKNFGVDRALNIYGAQSSYNKSFGVLDLGTAITFDFVNASGQHMGGWILAGPKLQALALSLGTAQLPEISLSRPSSRELGRSTKECLEIGIFQGLEAIVDRARSYCKTRRAKLILTGGWKGILRAGSGDHLKSDLLFCGMSEHLKKQLLWK